MNSHGVGVAPPARHMRQKRGAGGIGNGALWGSLLVVGLLFICLQLWLSGQLQASNLVTYAKVTNTRSSQKDAAAVKAPPSKSWLEGTRIGNVDDGLTKTDVQDLIAAGARGPFKNIIAATICHDASPLATSPDFDFTGGAGKWNREASSQIIYRAYHENQYGPARTEALARLEDWNAWEATFFASGGRQGKRDNETALERIGFFDFECPDAKFLVSDGFFLDVGLGSNLRGWHNAPAMYYGLAYQRTVLYIINDKNMSLASCDRRDLQCSFLPLSPCVITREELEKAPHAGSDLEGFLKKNPNERIIRTRGAGSIVGEKNKKNKLDVIGGIQKTIVELYSKQQSQTNDQQEALLSKTVRQIVSKDYNGIDSTLTIETAAQLFIVRPNRVMGEAIARAIKTSFPSNGFDSSTAIGMPIRASDKCMNEEICLEFGQYMEQIKQYFPDVDKIRHIVLTSEDEKVLKASRDYVFDGKGNSSRLQFIVNKDDVLQGFGQYTKVKKLKRKVSQDEIMRSTMTAWSFQLRADQIFLNRCSNFHLLIESTINFGCSAAISVKAQNVTCKRKR